MMAMKTKDNFDISESVNATNIIIRPIRPKDVGTEHEFAPGLLTMSKHWGYMENFSQLKPEMLLKFTEFDFNREMAFVALYKDNHKEINIGLARYIANPNQEDCEFAIVVAHEWQYKGAGSKLMTSLLSTAKKNGLKTLIGLVPKNNLKMLKFVQHFGFIISDNDISMIKIVTKLLI
jgi:acetyltransferase